MAWYNKLAVCAVIATTLIFAAVDAQSDEYLTPHNAARSDVGVGPLVWDDTLQAYAQDYANSQVAYTSVSSNSQSVNLYILNLLYYLLLTKPINFLTSAYSSRSYLLHSTEAVLK